eukprot:1401875-Pyramimonas_sp.AAC.1
MEEDHWDAVRKLVTGGCVFRAARAGAVASHELSHLVAAWALGRGDGSLTFDNLVIGAFVKHRVYVSHSTQTADKNAARRSVQAPTFKLRTSPTFIKHAFNCNTSQSEHLHQCTDLWIRHAGWVTSTLLAGGVTLFLQHESLPLELRAPIQLALWLTALDAGKAHRTNGGMCADI